MFLRKPATQLPGPVQASRLGRPQLSQSRLQLVAAVVLAFTLYVYWFEYSDRRRAQQWRVFFKTDQHMATLNDAYTAIAININGPCHAMARFGPPKADGGWNTCMQPGLIEEARNEDGSPVKVHCGDKEWDCPWAAVTDYQWPPKDKECIIYSFGSAWNFMFEVSVSRLGCQVHTFDPSMPAFTDEGWSNKLATLTKKGIVFHPIGLGPKDEESNGMGWKMRNLESIMKMLGHSRLEILKIDIEYGEWPVLEWLFFESKMLQKDSVRQIQLEIHMGPEASTDRLQRIMGMFQKFGFVLWARDNNDYCSHVTIGENVLRGCIELSYVRTKVKWV